jgi:translation initiation factor eIF-2B subunit beta
MQLQERIEAFIKGLKQCSVQGPYQVASQTVTVLKHIIGESSWKSASELMQIVKSESMKMIAAQPSEAAIGNMVRRVLKIIREECSGLGKPAEGEHEGVQRLLLTTDVTGDDFTKQDFPNLKAAVIESVNELIEELDASAENIAQQALEHIHANELILTAGKSKTVEAFLKRAAKKRKFQVIVVECAPFYQGHEMALSLSDAGIETTVITDSAVFAMMSRVNKVIVGTHTVMANGGLKAISGSHAIALAAKYYSVPFIVCTPMFKLSPLYLCSYDQEGFNLCVSPEAVLPFTEGQILSQIQVYNPVFDYVPPDLVTLFISNIGGNAPSYVYRLVRELYSQDDLEL